MKTVDRRGKPDKGSHEMDGYKEVEGESDRASFVLPSTWMAEEMFSRK